MRSTQEMDDLPESDTFEPLPEFGPTSCSYVYLKRISRDQCLKLDHGSAKYIEGAEVCLGSKAREGENSPYLPYVRSTLP